MCSTLHPRRRCVGSIGGREQAASRQNPAAGTAARRSSIRAMAARSGSEGARSDARGDSRPASRARRSSLSPSALSGASTTATRSRLKKACRRPYRDRPDVAAARRHRRPSSLHWEASDLVFIDETAVTTKMARLYGRTPVDERLVAKVPPGHWKTPTLVAALRVDDRALRDCATGLRKGAARTGSLSPTAA